MKDLQDPRLNIQPKSIILLSQRTFLLFWYIINKEMAETEEVAFDNWEDAFDDLD